MAMATTTIQLNPQEVERDEEEQVYNPATGRMTRRSAKKRGRGENTANDVSSTLSSSSINCFDDFPDEETTMKLISWIGTIQITSKVILINLSNVNTMNNTFDVELDIILETTNAQDVVVVVNDDVSSNQKKIILVVVVIIISVNIIFSTTQELTPKEFTQELTKDLTQEKLTQEKLAQEELTSKELT